MSLTIAAFVAGAGIILARRPIGSLLFERQREAGHPSSRRWVDTVVIVVGIGFMTLAVVALISS
jgi:hypothetical protein